MADDEIVPRLIRMPRSLLDKLGVWAKKNRRSVNAEAVFRIEESIRADERKEQRER